MSDYGNNMNIHTCKFEDYVDIQTNITNPTLIELTMDGNMIKRRLAPFFGAYKYYRYHGMKVTMVPASMLPADPGSVTTEAGQNTTDPRDMLNPGLMRFINGEYMAAEGPGTTPSVEQYIQTMLDPRWMKFKLQTGFEKYGSALVYDIATNVNYSNIGALMAKSDPVTNAFLQDGSAIPEQVTDNLIFRVPNSASIAKWGGVSPAIFNSGKGKAFGWLPTDTGSTGDGIGAIHRVAAPPNVPMFAIILPKAERTLFYYRMFLTYYVHFKGDVFIDQLATNNMLDHGRAALLGTEGPQPPMPPLGRIT